MRIAQPIYIPDYMIVLLHIKDGKKRTMTEIANESGMMYGHIFKLKKVFLEKGLINIAHIGLRHDITISSLGLNAVTSIEQLMDIFNITMEDLKRMRNEIKLKRNANKNTMKEGEDEVKEIKEGENNGTNITY